MPSIYYNWHVELDKHNGRAIDVLNGKWIGMDFVVVLMEEWWPLAIPSNHSMPNPCPLEMLEHHRGLAFGFRSVVHKDLAQNMRWPKGPKVNNRRQSQSPTVFLASFLFYFLSIFPNTLLPFYSLFLAKLPQAIFHVWGPFHLNGHWPIGPFSIFNLPISSPI